MRTGLLTRTKRTATLVAGTYLLCGCAGIVQPVPIHYEVLDDPENETIVLHYMNRSDRAICLSSGQWPNLNGVVDRPPDTVLLTVTGQVFRIGYAETGYCAGCRVEIAPGQRITGRFPYERFQLPKTLYAAPKELEMKVTPTECR